jgi:hypothetical protein
MGRDNVVACFKASRHLLGRTEEKYKKSVRVVDVLAEI